MKKVTLYLDEHIWRLFRVACLEQSTSASKEVEQLMRQSLTQQKPKKSTKQHA